MQANYYRAKCLATEYMFTIDLQIKRLQADEKGDKVFVFRKWTDARFLILALTWLEKSVREPTKDCYSMHFQTMRTAHKRFQDSIPNLYLLRNVTEHTNEYTFGSGRASYIHRSHLQVSSLNKDGLHWLVDDKGNEVYLDFNGARSAAVELYKALLEARPALDSANHRQS